MTEQSSSLANCASSRRSTQISVSVYKLSSYMSFSCMKFSTFETRLAVYTISLISDIRIYCYLVLNPKFAISRSAILNFLLQISFSSAILLMSFTRLI